ncbi:UNVERIFIED_ORG: hypothetical protein ABIB52_000305 [Arthrobacter sp. UYCu721]
MGMHIQWRTVLFLRAVQTAFFASCPSPNSGCPGMHFSASKAGATSNFGNINPSLGTVAAAANAVGLHLRAADD